MPPKTAPRESGVLDPQTQRIALTLPVLLSLIATVVGGAIYAVRVLDRTSTRLDAHDTILNRVWTLDYQREWTRQFQVLTPGASLPDPDNIREKLRK